MVWMASVGLLRRPAMESAVDWLTERSRRMRASRVMGDGSFGEGGDGAEGGGEVVPGEGFAAFGGVGCCVAEVEGEFAEAGGFDDVG